MTQRDDLEPDGGLGIAAAEGGSVKSRRLGQICVGANSRGLAPILDAPDEWHNMTNFATKGCLDI